MSFFILAETSAGYALLKAKDKKLLKKDDYSKDLDSVDKTCAMLKLRDFTKFASATQALEEATAIQESKVTPMLANMLDIFREEKKATLVVAEPKLGQSISKLPGLSITVVSDSRSTDFYRAIREHLTSLIPALAPASLSIMSLGLSHSLSRHKLKFSTDKVDVMIIQAIALLDDLDKELNIYAMRVKEWYGWHFPEMGKIVGDNLAYARVIRTMGMRSSASTCDLSEVLPEEIEAAVKVAAEVSMGTEITEDDLEHINALAEQVISFSDYRTQLSQYLSARMQAIAPNLTALVGELVGARLISHAGSLMSLAKSPASTIQILGAEKALFRALKTKHDTPKYGLIFHASLIGQSTGKNKGKIARMLATKAAIGLRVDALSEDKDDVGALGMELRARLEGRVRVLEGKPALTKGVSIAPQAGKWEIREARKYNPDADSLMADAPPQALLNDIKQLKMEESGSDDDMKDDVVQEKASEKAKKSKKDSALSKKELKKKEKEERRARKEQKRKGRAEKLTAKVAAVNGKGESDDDDISSQGSAAASQLATEAAAATLSEAAATALPESPAENGFSDDSDASASEKKNGVAAMLPPDPPSSKQRKSKKASWESSILGDSKADKKARKAERHERRTALSLEKVDEHEKHKKYKKEERSKTEERKRKREDKEPADKGSEKKDKKRKKHKHGAE